MKNFRINKTTDGQFHFTLRADNNKVILTSELYKKKSNAKKGIRAVILNGYNPENYRFLTSKNGKQYWVLMAPNGEIVATSQMYSSLQAALSGMKSVMKHSQY